MDDQDPKLSEIKLTTAQRLLLEEAAQKGTRGIRSVSYYRPLVKLLREGLVDDGNGGKGTVMSHHWFITTDGEAWLRRHPKRST